MQLDIRTIVKQFSIVIYFHEINSFELFQTILPVSDNVNAEQFLENIKSFDDELLVTESALGHCHIT